MSCHCLQTPANLPFRVIPWAGHPGAQSVPIWQIRCSADEQHCGSRGLNQIRLSPEQRFWLDNHQGPAERDLSHTLQIARNILKFFSELRSRPHNRYRWFFQVLINVSFDEQACVVGRFPRTAISGAILHHEGRQALRIPGSLFVKPSTCRFSSEPVDLAEWVRFSPKR